MACPVCGHRDAGSSCPQCGTDLRALAGEDGEARLEVVAVVPGARDRPKK